MVLSKINHFTQLAVLDPIKQRNNLDFALRNKQELINFSVGQHYLIVTIILIKLNILQGEQE